MSSAKRRYKVCIGFLLSMLLATGCQDGPSIEGPLKIVVVGNAVPTDLELGLETPIPRGFPRDDAKGEAIWKAARLAFERFGPGERELRVPIALHGVDDFGDTLHAARVARRIGADPTVLAVVGSTASSTSRAVGTALEAFGIPFLMPIATSPDAILHPRTGERIRTSIRLPPSDSRVQAPGVASLVLNTLKGRRIALIEDTDPGARTYSQPLCNDIGRHLGEASWNLFRHPGSTDATGVVNSVAGGNFDVVVFCGYVGGAEQLLYSFNRMRREGENGKVRIVLTDGTLDRRLNAGKLDVYLTFPLPPVDSMRVRTEPDNDLLQLIREGGAQSYEVYAYDAIRMLLAGIRKCHPVTRACLLQEIPALQPFSGPASTYTFIDGENASAAYFVYRWHNDELGRGAFELFQVLTQDDLVSQH